MMSSFVPLRHLPSSAGYKPGDVLVVFGELFSRGYANGIVDEAERAGLKVIRSTVGRRESDGHLRPLTDEELATQPRPFINAPLEAGFDLEPCSQDGTTPVDQLAGCKMNEWDQVKLDWNKIKDSRAKGIVRFQQQVDTYMRELEAHIPKGANVIFLHTMAGGVPRAKIIMPTMNRVFKGTGDRHVPSKKFWDSDLGRLAEMSFEEVTANTFQHLLEGSRAIRARVEREGGSVRYLAFGYHGTEVLVKGEYRWQTYTPYVQGWAKMKLEKLATDAFKSGIPCTVYNAPEILTNSTTIFLGVEVSLYPLLSALRKEGSDSKRVQSLLERCKGLLKSGHDFDEIQAYTDQYLTSETVLQHTNFEKWPDHNSKEQMELMLASSAHLIGLHKDEKDLITYVLSEQVFRATGHVMYNDSWKPQAPVLWLGHDVLAKALASDRTL